MKIIQFEPKDRKRVRQFLQLPFEIYRDILLWVPPLSVDQKAPFNSRNPFYQHSEASFFLALADDDRPLARLVIINNRNYNDFNQEKVAFFWMFECIDDRVVSQEIFAAGFEWARRRGLKKVIGPRGFTALDGSGLLTKGFEHRPAFGLPYNPAYYVDLIESNGFRATGESVSGYLPTTIELPDKVARGAEIVKKRRGLWVARYEKRKDLQALVPKLKDLYNNALGGTTGNVPLADAEAQGIADQMLRFADPRLIKIVMREDKPIGFLFAYPDVSEAVQKIRGRVFPLGWITLLRAYKTTEWVNVNGAGIAEEYRGIGGTALLFDEMYKSVQQAQFKHADLVQIGVENDNMQRELRSWGIDFYKMHRVYEKELQ
jgi:hypothetical protein